MNKNHILFGMVILIIALSMVGSVSAATFTNYTYEAEETSLHFYFTEDMKLYDFYYNNELVLYTITDEGFIPNLEPDTDYSFIIYDGATKDIQIVTGHTLPVTVTHDEFYFQYGLIGLMLLIIICLFLSVKMNYLALISILLSFVGFGYCSANDYGFITTFIFVILMLISILTYAKGDY